MVLALWPPHPKSSRLIGSGTRQKTPRQVQLSLAEFTGESSRVGRSIGAARIGNEPKRG